MAKRDSIFLSNQDDSCIQLSFSPQLALRVILKLTRSKLLQQSCEVALKDDACLQAGCVHHRAIKQVGKVPHAASA